MKAKILILAVAMPFAAVFAQQKQGPKLPVKVPNVELTDLDKNPTKFSEYGKKHMMIFYVDPDAHKQNKDFLEEFEADGRAIATSIQHFAVLNLKDTLLPNGIVRSMTEKRTKGQPAVSLADSDRILSTAWGLGDCNNKFCILFVTKDCELVYFRSGELTRQDITDLYATVDKYK